MSPLKIGSLAVLLCAFVPPVAAQKKGQNPEVAKNKIEQKILDGLRNDLDTTMVIVAQRLSTIELADRVIYLRDGRVQAVGSHDELMADESYTNLVTAYERATP